VPTAQAYMPLTAGNWWQYEYRMPTVATAQSDRIPDRSTRRVLGSHTINNQQWFEIEVVDWSSEDGIDDPIGRNVIWMRETIQGVYLYDEVNKTALPWIKKTAQVGDTWTPDVDLDIVWELRSKTDTVQTAAGKFSGCLVVAERDVFGMGSETIEEVWERWFKRGIGMVMDRYWSDVPEVQQYGDLKPWDEAALMAYQVK